MGFTKNPNRKKNNKTFYGGGGGFCWGWGRGRGVGFTKNPNRKKTTKLFYLGPLTSLGQTAPLAFWSSLDELERSLPGYGAFYVCSRKPEILKQ